MTPCPRSPSRAPASGQTPIGTPGATCSPALGSTTTSWWRRRPTGRPGSASAVTATARNPSPGPTFTATYRVGCFAAGNIGAGVDLPRRHRATPAISAVDNPLPARAALDPETPDEVRRDAPHAFFVQERAVTPGDYAEMAQRSGQVQRAAATFRWTGSWHTVFVTADRAGGANGSTPTFEAEPARWLERFRMAGYDLEVERAGLRPLEIDVLVCAGPRAPPLRHRGRRSRRAQRRHVNPDGSLGLFHPDQLTFGQPVYLSSLHAALHAIEGVESVGVSKFQRLGQPATSGLDAGCCPMQRLEIARLDNDPNFPERGQLRSGREVDDERRTCGCCPPASADRHPLAVAQPAGALSRSATAAGPGPTSVEPCWPGSPRQRRRLAESADPRRPTTRRIALLDAWAVTCDVLTFYNERLAQESFLRHRRRDDVAAGARPADRLPAGPGRGGRDAPRLHARAAAHSCPRSLPTRGWHHRRRPHEVTLPVGLRVQSIPGPGERPQTFETVEEVIGRPEWSSMPVAPPRCPIRPVAGTGVWFQGTDSQPEPGRRHPDLRP